MDNIICFNIHEPYSVYVPWATQPQVEFFPNWNVETTVVLAGEPTIIIGRTPKTIKVWKITIHPAKILISGTVKFCNREWFFSTFKPAE